MTVLMNKFLFLPSLLFFIFVLFLIFRMWMLSTEGRQTEHFLQFAALAVLVCSAVWLLFFLSFRKQFILLFADPLTKLSKTASAIAAGDIYEIAEIENEDEIGTAAGSLNAIAEKLRFEVELERIRNRTLLRKTQQELEKRVRERTAELALAKDDAEAANRARSAFLANMTHELRTPMNAILGFTRLMTDDPLIPPDQKETLGIIKRSAEDLLKMITKILETAKMESDKAIMEISSLDLYQLVREVDEIMRVQAEYKGLVFSINRHPDLPRLIKTDRSKLRETLLNLLSNAVKFTRAGEVSLSITPLANNAINFPSGLKFRVEDTGPGIAPEYLERIFEPFFQVSDSYESGEGAGLGLSICRKFVSLMGGELGVESQVGAGSVFSFDIRIEPADEKPPEKSPRKRRVVGIAPGQTPPGILVAENDENNRTLLVRILQMAGFETLEARNGLEVLEKCKKRRPKMILMNTRLPLMDGYETARIIKLGKYGHIKIIALTAGVLEEKIEKIRASGFDGFISKPFHENDIFDAVETHLGINFIHVSEREGPDSAPEEKETDIRPGLNAQSLAKLPAPLIENLEKAVSIGSMEMISKIVAEIRGKDAELARALEKLADEFKYDRILCALRGAQAKGEKNEKPNPDV